MFARAILFFLALTVGLLSANDLRAQSACLLKLSELPESAELRGFRLGMTKDDVKARVPQVAFGKTDKVGVSKTTINPHFDPKIDKSAFGGIRSVSLDFLDGRLTSLWFGYDNSFKWKSLDQFVEGISEALRLPDSWQTWRTRGQQLKCADFLISITVLGEGVSFRIQDRSAEDLIANRRAAHEDERTAAEKAERQRQIVGDARSKTYYPVGCAPPDTLSEQDRTFFPSVTEAEEAGFKKAKECPDENSSVNVKLKGA